MIKLGFLINSLGASQLAVSLTSQMNALVDEKPNYSVCAFYRNFAASLISPNFALFSEFETWTFDGAVIATDVRSAQVLLKCPGPLQKYFYVWEPEWALKRLTKYSQFSQVYQSSEMPLLARSQYHYDIISKIWQEPLAVIEDFNYDQITNLITKTS